MTIHTNVCEAMAEAAFEFRGGGLPMLSFLAEILTLSPYLLAIGILIPFSFANFLASS